MQKAVDVDEEKISEYFPVEHVMGAMLGLFTSFLGLRFDKLSDDDVGEDIKWHESVAIFAVWDGSSERAHFIGYLYMDLIWREHKYRGNQNGNLECGYLKLDGSRKYPSTILSYALPTPASRELQAPEAC
ncbi:putative Peptidase M3A/M3B catalytic domain-containing protein [Seiridium cardinale]